MLISNWSFFTINSGAATTNTTAVTLNVNCPVDIWVGGEVIIYDNNTNMNGGTRTWCEITKPRVLAGPDWVNTVYMKTRDSLGNISEPYSDTIILETIQVDSTSPIVGTWYISVGTTGINTTNWNYYYKWNPTIRASVSDEIALSWATCEYTINGTDWYQADYHTTYCDAGISGGPNLSIKFRIQDTAGNTTVGWIWTYIYDILPPAVL
jgi:hypothetical protein